MRFGNTSTISGPSRAGADVGLQIRFFKVRDLDLGKCGAAFIHRQRIESAHSGIFVSDDRKKVEEGKLQENEAVCVKDKQGNVDMTRDCKYRQVISY